MPINAFNSSTAAVAIDAEIVLGHPLSARQASLTSIAGTRVDAVQSDPRLIEGLFVHVDVSFSVGFNSQQTRPAMPDSRYHSYNSIAYEICLSIRGTPGRKSRSIIWTV